MPLLRCHFWVDQREQDPDAMTAAVAERLWDVVGAKPEPEAAEPQGRELKSRPVETSEPNTSQRIVVVRHGETEWSREKRHTGRTDLPLTAEGREQASTLVAQLAGRSFAAVFVSPLQRARQTCEIAGFGDRAVVDPDLIEWDYGEFDGLTGAEIQQRIAGMDAVR